MESLYQSLASRSRQTAARVWQPRNTSSVIFSKGLLNAPGENNCFLNSAVQVLWHLDVFRRSFREMGGHACMGKACIFCALKVLFTQLRYSEQQSLPPDALRKALAVAFQDEHRFQLGCMDDAAECFENILTRIHFHLAHDIKEDLCDAKYCIPHRKFAMTLIEHSVCTCGATSEPFPFTQMVHYVSCTALCTEARKLREKHRWSNSVCFGQVLRSAGAIGDIRDCPSECGKKINIRRVLMNCPDVVAIGLVWDSDCPEKDHIVDVIQCLGTSLRMPDLFNSVVDDKAKQAALHLVGVVTYYGKHYSTFFYNTALRLWVYFDDATVKQVGPNWRDVVNRCQRGHSQPLLLLFANPEGTPVPTDMAPKESTLFPGYTELKSPTAPKPSGSGGIFNNPLSSSNGIKCKQLQPVFEYEPEHEIPRKSIPGRKALEKNRQKYVVEIGHDAVQKIQARYDGGGSTSAGNESHTQRSRDKYENSSNPVENTSIPTGEGKLPSRMLYCDPVSSVSDDSKNIMYSRCTDETFGNMSPVHSQGLPISDFDASCPFRKSEPSNRHSSDHHHAMTNPGQLPPRPRRLERHESWNGCPSHMLADVPKASQPRLSVDNKYSIHRHHSFNHGPLSNSKQQSVHNVAPDLQRNSCHMNSLGDRGPPHTMSKSHVSDYPSKQPMSQFGSVPNLHRGFDLKTGKSVSVQNISMAEDGILASAIKNHDQQKRASTSDVLMYRRDSEDDCNSQHLTSTVGSGQELPLESTSDQNNPARIGISGSTGAKIQNVAATQLSRYSRQDKPKQMSMQRPDTLKQNMNKSSLLLGYSLHDRDSVASRDSGYRSRDRSRASSGSAYSIETPISSTSENLKEQTQVLYDFRPEGSQKALSRTHDAEAICDEVCAECADLEVQSRLKGDAGDFATALALCTTAVTKLKGCMNLDALSPQKRQYLHSKYNTAVLHSRSLHRRLTLLRSLGSFPAGNDLASINMQNQPVSSQPAEPARELNLINLQGTTHEFSHVDRLKQQLKELYKQDHATSETSVQCAQQENPQIHPVMGPRRMANITTHSQTLIPTSGFQQSNISAHERNTFQEQPESYDNYSRMTNFNRNQNARSESYNGWIPDTSIHLRHEKAGRAPTQAVGTREEPRRNSMAQQGLHVHVPIDPRRNSMTATMTPAQDKYDLTRQNGKSESALYSTYV